MSLASYMQDLHIFANLILYNRCGFVIIGLVPCSHAVSYLYHLFTVLYNCALDFDLVFADVMIGRVVSRERLNSSKLDRRITYW